MIDDLIAVSNTEFEEKVLQSSLPVIVDFWAPWCGPSNRIAPVLEEIANRFAGQLIVAKVNTDEDRDWAIKYCVQRIPTMLFLHKGSLLFEHLGAIPAPYLLELVEDFLAKAREISDR